MENNQHRAMVHRTDARNPYWSGIGPWRGTVDEAKKDADEHRLKKNPVAKIRIYSLTSEDYNG